jgi:hypothetical protein
MIRSYPAPGCEIFLGTTVSIIFWQCEVSDQIQNKRSDQMFKSEFKMIQWFIDKIKSEQIINNVF